MRNCIVQYFVDPKLYSDPERGWYQALHHQWNDSNYINVHGGETLVKCCTATREIWETF